MTYVSDVRQGANQSRARASQGSTDRNALSIKSCHPCPDAWSCKPAKNLCVRRDGICDVNGYYSTFRNM